MKNLLKTAGIILLIISIMCGANSCKKSPSPPVVVTADVTDITTNTAVTGGNVTDDGGAEVTSRGVCWGETPNLTTADSKTDEGPGPGAFTSTLTGLEQNTTYYVVAYATNSEGLAFGEEKSFTTGQLRDADGNVYSEITIGDQVWMVENLRTTRYNDGSAVPSVTDPGDWIALTTGGYCWYDNDVSYKDTYGALYNWNAVNTGKLCPDGWHVPTDDDWTLLENYLVSNGYNFDGTTTGNKTGKALSSSSGWNYSSVEGSIGNTDFPQKRNATGFSALPGGSRKLDGSFDYLGRGTLFWSSTQSSETEVWSRDLYFLNVDLRRDYDNKILGCYVRCLKN